MNGRRSTAVTTIRQAALLGLALLSLGATVRAQNVPDTDARNVVVILDASGSMSTRMHSGNVTRMEAAKSALTTVLRQVPQDTHIGLLVYGSGNRAPYWAFELGPRDDARLMRVIDAVRPGGSTPLGQSLKMAADRLLEQRERQRFGGEFRMLVVTDGEASDSQLMNAYIPRILSSGLIVDAIGVDMKQTHTLATKAHSYRRADDPEMLKTAVEQIFAEIGSAGTDHAGGDAFDLIAPLPDEMASAMLTALDRSRRVRRIAAATGADLKKEQAAANRQTAQAPPPPPAQHQPISPRGNSSPNLVLYVIAAVVILSFLAKTRKRR